MALPVVDDGPLPPTTTLENRLVKWRVRVEGTPHLVVSHVANHPRDVGSSGWIPWQVAKCPHPVLLDQRTAAAMDGHAIDVVVSLKRPGGAIIHAVVVGARSSNDVDDIRSPAGDAIRTPAQ